MSSPRLVGVGVGPGDPDLMTLKAVDVLRTADLVVVPCADVAVVGRAEATVRHHVHHDRVRRLHFAVDERDDRGRRERAWDDAGRVVIEALQEQLATGTGATVAFATIGDPNVYSTFSYLAATVRASLPDLDVSTVPGITAMQHLAAKAGVPLVEGQEVLTLYPVTAGLRGLQEALRHSDTVVAYKGGRLTGEVLASMRDAGRAGVVVGAALGLDGERVVVGAESSELSSLPYLSTVLSAPADRTRGGRL